jgi:hypothetical protein
LRSARASYAALPPLGNGLTRLAGFDWMIWKNVSFCVEYPYVNLGSETDNGTLKGNVTFCGE